MPNIQGILNNGKVKTIILSDGFRLSAPASTSDEDLILAVSPSPAPDQAPEEEKKIGFKQAIPAKKTSVRRRKK